MSDGFGGELAQVGGTLVTMARAARESMRQASAALLSSDHALAQQVTERDAEIDVLSRVLEDRVYELVARQPDGRNVTKLMTAIRVAAHLERMGDLAVHVARAALRRHPGPAVVPELAELFSAMSAVADDLAGKIVSALTDHDAVLAAQLDADDDVMDELHRRLFGVMLSQEWPMGVEGAIDGALLGRFYERYADQAVNVGRHVASLVTDPA
ncbi:phosphate signaling complex PhoU family protein [Paractinoplanes maris]|uniref:phosphate signaling complex PhoU family protein n=1 Tax=Paractinoplanes maris TaxID=1734446 RepID=UPI0020222C65|nr:PhoU domain-containing protein [Actinoplanes maris]